MMSVDCEDMVDIRSRREESQNVDSGEARHGSGSLGV